jgi:hypothetical protein
LLRHSITPRQVPRRSSGTSSMEVNGSTGGEARLVRRRTEHERLARGGGQADRALVGADHELAHAVGRGRVELAGDQALAAAAEQPDAHRLGAHEAVDERGRGLDQLVELQGLA